MIRPRITRAKVIAGLALLISLAAVGAWAALTIRPIRKVLVSITALQQAYSIAYFKGAAPEGVTWLGNGGPARGIILNDPSGIAEDRSGNVFIADRGYWWGLQAIWKIGVDGTARVIAGTSRKGSCPESADARRTALGQPEGLAVDARGRVYFADAYNNVLMRIEPDGRLVRIAGTRERGFAGDGGPARDAKLNQPFDVRLGQEGKVFVADYGNHRIRMISRDGTIRTVAGTGEPGYSGDGGSATTARLNGPYGILLDQQGRLLIADSQNHVIRRIDKNGMITTIAGTGERGYAGDGGPALRAKMDTPEALLVDRDGGLYIDDEHNNAIRFVGADGRISTLIGKGIAGYSADGTPIGAALINDPENLLLRSDGTLLFTEGDNHLVRLVTPDGRLRSFAGQDPE